MGRLLPLLLLSMTCLAAVAFVATARIDDHNGHPPRDDGRPPRDDGPHPPRPQWVHVPHAEKIRHIQALGEFAVKSYNNQSHGRLIFQHVIDAEKLERAPGHYTYRLLIKALPFHGRRPELYKSLVMENAAHHGHQGKPPVLSFGYFVPAH